MSREKLGAKNLPTLAHLQLLYDELKNEKCEPNTRRAYAHFSRQNHRPAALCCLDYVVVTVLATGHKGRGFEAGRGDGFLRAIKFRSTPSFGREVKPEVPYRKILRHVKNQLTYLKILTPSSIPSACSRMSLLVGLPESFSERDRSFPQPAWPSMLTYHPGDEQ
jgi:hypothetical protein